MNALVRVLSLPAVILSKVPGIGPIIRACCTSVGQKVLMALTGLSLSGFLVAHLSGNFLLYAGETEFNAYAEKLHSLGPLLVAAEIGLFGMFLLHIGLAISTIAMNRAARARSYDMKDSKQSNLILPGGASSWMVVTGVLIGIFLVCHLLDLKFKWFVGDGSSGWSPVAYSDTSNEFYSVVNVLSDPLHAVIYSIGFIALGIHLSHGVRSALQSLGLSHPRWDGLLKFLGYAFAWAIAAGFLSLIMWVFAFAPDV